MKVVGIYSNNLLAKGSEVMINEVYAIATQEESQKSLNVANVVAHRDALTMLIGRTQGFMYKNAGRRIPCREYGYRNHRTEDCYRCVSNPADFKSKKKNPQGNELKPFANSTTPQRIGCLFTKEE